MAYQYVTRKTYDIVNMPIGDDWREFIPIVQSDKETAWDFTSWKAVAEVRDKDGNLIIAFDSESSTPTIEFADGGMYLIAEDAVTADLSANNYVWSCRFTDADDYLRSQILNSDFEIVETSVE